LRPAPFGASCSRRRRWQGLAGLPVCDGFGHLARHGRWSGRVGRPRGLPVIPSPRQGGMMGCAVLWSAGSIRIGRPRQF